MSKIIEFPKRGPKKNADKGNQQEAGPLEAPKPGKVQVVTDFVKKRLGTLGMGITAAAMLGGTVYAVDHAMKRDKERIHEAQSEYVAPQKLGENLWRIEMKPYDFEVRKILWKNSLEKFKEQHSDLDITDIKPEDPQADTPNVFLIYTKQKMAATPSALLQQQQP